MTRHTFICAIGAAGLLLTSCATHYRMTGISRTRVLIDQRWDAAPDAGAVALLAPYKQRVDSMMSPVVGRTTHYMEKHRPESDLSNLLADVLLWGGAPFGEKPDFAVYNMGGIRAALPEGEVTYGDVLNVAPFENKICFLTLTGEKTLELLRQIAALGGEAVSHGVRMVITPTGKLVSATVNGEEVTAGRSYRIATLDYLAQGNDHLDAFKDKTDVVSPQDERNNVRHIICDYFRDAARQGRAVDTRVEGRITVKPETTKP